MHFIGKPSISPVPFYTGKASVFIVRILFVLSFVGIIGEKNITRTGIVAYVLTAIGLIVTIISLISLGKSTRVGLPSEDTTFQSRGLYKYSRNPMYIGFHLITLAGMIYVGSIIIIALGLYGIIAYHYIILGEEEFLEERFGQIYIAYKNRVRRYF